MYEGWEGRMSKNGEQEEELEVLRSIYEFDERFKEVDSTTFQYKVGETGHVKSFLLEVSWPDEYPNVVPDINLGAFYNKHVSEGVKESIVSKAKEQCEICLGTAMTFSIFNWAIEEAEQLMANQTNMQESNEVQATGNGQTNTGSLEQTKRKTEKKEVLSKQQKRKLADRTNFKGERERGWNWVDIVKHLSKTGSS